MLTFPLGCELKVCLFGPLQSTFGSIRGGKASVLCLVESIQGQGLLHPARATLFGSVIDGKHLNLALSRAFGCDVAWGALRPLDPANLDSNGRIWTCTLPPFSCILNILPEKKAVRQAQ